MTKKFQKYSIGGVLKIPLGDGWYTYGQMIGDAQIAFFDAKTQIDLPINEIVSRPVLFSVAVYRYAVSKFVWLKVGKADLSDKLKFPQLLYIQDSIHPDRFEIYCNGDIRLSTKEECKGLERCAVWEPEQVVDRINDFYNGVPCKWLDDLF